MEAGFQPGHQPGLGRGQIHPGHANLGKSELAGPVPDASHELSAIEIHLPIVESTVWSGEDATAACARRLAARPEIRQAFIALRGDLGAGKTTFVRHLLRALGVSGRIKSPTYAVVEPHQAAGLSIWHFDFYRFSDPREWEDAGFRDLFAAPGLKLAEWPDQASGYLPTPDLELELQARDDESRLARWTARTATGRALIEAVRA